FCTRVPGPANSSIQTSEPMIHQSAVQTLPFVHEHVVCAQLQIPSRIRFNRMRKHKMKLHPKWRIILSAVLVALFCGSLAAIAGATSFPPSKKLQIEFFTYNPTRKADLDCFFEEHKGRLAATIKQNHQIGESAAGTIVNGLLGARAKDLTLQLDLSDD